MKKIFLNISALIFLVLLGLNILFYIKSLTLSNRIRELESKIEKLKIENNKLETYVLKNTSLEIISKKASVLGFSDKSTIVNISKPDVAQAR